MIFFFDWTKSSKSVVALVGALIAKPHQNKCEHVLSKYCSFPFYLFIFFFKIHLNHTIFLFFLYHRLRTERKIKKIKMMACGKSPLSHTQTVNPMVCDFSMM